MELQWLTISSSEPSQFPQLLILEILSNSYSSCRPPKKPFQMKKKQLKPITTHSFVMLCYFCLAFISSTDVSRASDMLNNSQSVMVNETLISLRNRFQLGFFDPGNSSRFYLGIRYNQLPTQTIVWIANRDKPLNDTSGVLRIGSDGNLIIQDKANTAIWSTSIKNLSSSATSVQLLDSGNLVLRDSNEGIVLWQSFDHPSDTILAGMKIGWDLRTGFNRYLTSWKSSDDPSPGEYTLGFDLHGLPQMVTLQGSSKWFRTAPWNGMDFGGVVAMIDAPFTSNVVINPEEVYYGFSLDEKSSLVRIVLTYLGIGQFHIWDTSINAWRVMLEYPPDNCGKYNFCGANSICTINNSPICSCLIGYTPRYVEQWQLGIWTGGCVRKNRLNCSEGEGFREINDVKKPDLLQFWVNPNMSLQECKAECLKNCSCTAYANTDATGSGHGCLLWYGDLIDVRKITDSLNARIFLRVSVSDLESEGKNRKKMVVIVVITAAASVLLLLAVSFIIWKRKSIQKGRRLFGQIANQEHLDLPSFDMDIIAKATDEFSHNNKIGEGGFGPVYKGVLQGGQQIAVKRLSENSTQGLKEYKNEVMLIAKLQHRNLVRLLGCCFQEDERMLIYEYMPNGSLDSYIFGDSNYGKRHLLAWRRRFSIIVGIARGLLYLHRDSRLTIVHRDLKASNVLLDTEMNPKISDFGMARTFRAEQSTTQTKRIAGTFGYMAPEYAISGIFSMKSDVFSFGVLVLEIVSGQRNSRFHHPDHDYNLLGHAWQLWEKGRAFEVIDPLMEDSFPISEVLRCIQIGLLCVQQRSEDRPTMASVLLMLDSEIAILPQPKHPGFIEKYLYDESYNASSVEGWTKNEITNTMTEGR